MTRAAPALIKMLGLTATSGVPTTGTPAISSITVGHLRVHIHRDTLQWMLLPPPFRISRSHSPFWAVQARCLPGLILIRAGHAVSWVDRSSRTVVACRAFPVNEIGPRNDRQRGCVRFGRWSQIQQFSWGRLETMSRKTARLRLKVSVHARVGRRSTEGSPCLFQTKWTNHFMEFHSYSVGSASPPGQ